MKFTLKKVISVVLSLATVMTAFGSLGFSTSAAAVKNTVKLTSIDDIRNNFYSYYTPKDYTIEAVDENEISLYKECDPAFTWQVSNNILKRYGNGEYATGNGRKGAGSLYFKDFYENFELEYDYNIAVSAGWRWAGIGFGAEKIGGHFVSDGFYAYVEQEGTMRIFGETSNAPYFQSVKYDDYATYFKNDGNWVHFKASVLDGTLTLTYTYIAADGSEKSVTAKKFLSSDYKGGYVYLNCYTQNMQFKNLTIKRLQSYLTSYTESYAFNSLSDVSDNFISYGFSNSETFGAKDENGVSLINKTDVSDYWRINAENSAIERYGTDGCAGGSGYKGAALLYFPKEYDDFEFTAQYRFSNPATNGSYKWMGMGFGAENIGDCFQKDSYFAVVEQEGTIRLHLKRAENEDALAHYSQSNEEYTAQVKTNLNTEIWHTFTVRVVGSNCYISFDGNSEFVVGIPQDTTGYAYMFANTQYMQIKDVKMTRYLYGDSEHTIEVWPQEYEVESYTAGAVSDIVKNNKKFSFNTVVNGKKTPLSVTFPTDGGVRITGEKSGFFEPDGLNEITYSETADGINLSSGGETVKFRYNADKWQIITVNGKEESVALSSEKLYFGYKDGKTARIKYAFPINSGEKFYGLGERYNAVNQNGYSVTLWNHDTTYHIEGAGGDKTDSYANVPIIHSTNGYTIFFNSTYSAEADIGYTDGNICSFDFNGDILDLYIFNGNPTENMREYTAITGRPYVPEKWAFGYWMGSARNLYDTAVEEAKSVAEKDGKEFTYVMRKQAVADKVADVLENYREMGTVPYAMYGEGDFIDFSDVTLPIVTSYGAKGLLWSCGHTTLNNMYNYLDCFPLDLPLVKVLSNQLKFFGKDSYTHIDFTNPLAKTLVRNANKTKVANGMHGYMVDMGEYIAEDTLFYNGKTGAEMHNLYSYYYAKVQNEAMTELLGNDFVLFERSGCAGSWQYAACFGGDQRAAWYGLKQQLSGLITASASGFSIYGADIGGLYGRPNDELYMRWVQFSAFTPLMREHGTADDGLPWTYSTAAKQNFIDYYNTREVLLDHIYSAALESGNTGVPMSQAPAMAFPNEEAVKDVEDEYLFCGNLLVAPVTTEGADSRSVTLPTGIWYNLWDGTEISGGKTVNVEVAADTIPVYVKSGTVTALSLSEEMSLKKSGDVKTLLITPPEKDGVSTLYTSAEESYDFSLEMVSDKAFTLKKTADDGYSKVIIYGFKATAVNADGVELSTDDFYVEGQNTVVTMPKGSESITFYCDGVLRKNNITEIHPESDADLENFVTYSATAENRIEDVDDKGNSVFKPVNGADIWEVPYKGVIRRNATAEYTSSEARYGASSLYFDGDYTDFEIEFSYNYDNANSPWRWVSVGFGAKNLGDSYFDNGYLALLEQEGTLKIIGDADENKKTKTYNLKNNKEEGYPELEKWYTFRLRVVGNTATMHFGDKSYSYTLPNYTGGKIYLHCFTNRMMFKDIKIIDLSNADYGLSDRFEIGVSETLSFGSINVNKKAAFAGDSVVFTVTPNAGFKNGGVSVTGFNGIGTESIEITEKGSGVYTFTMPPYPVIINSDCYLPCDANCDGKADILDLIRIKKYLADSRSLLHTSAADIMPDSVIDAKDAAALRKILLLK